MRLKRRITVKRGIIFFTPNSKIIDLLYSMSAEKGNELFVYTNSNRYVRFWFLLIGLMFFFGCHNYMQELIMSLPGFNIGILLGYLEVLGVSICSFVERKVQGETMRKASWTSYAMLCLVLLISSATSNIALAYINYPTKVVFRSCKLIPTMLIAVSYNKKKVQWYEFLFGGFISIGMVLFAAADFQVYPNFNFIGEDSDEWMVIILR